MTSEARIIKDFMTTLWRMKIHKEVPTVLEGVIWSIFLRERVRGK